MWMWHLDVLKLGIAALLGAVLGLERELKRKPLGLKTCIIICVTSCLLTIVSIDSALVQNASSALKADPTRITAQIVSGIGFLGAGVILRKSHEVISGLTTAAMVWAASGLGITIGSGFYIEAVAGLLFMIVGVEVLPWGMRRWGPRVMRERELEVSIVIEDERALTDLLKQMDVLEYRVERIQSTSRSESLKEVTLLCVVDHATDILTLQQTMNRIEGIRSTSIETL